ncbi:hypothetical protein HPB47_023394 [Ixodes persulcatus]|uniref:Uncharacterized protein n=1 Tax=Ixodes persulcatus TaxID=34615 RepID=A0AC60Q739_IXOPE|nr:hypothetical protein HPB47_023394 [Ixodes persulcatus]
MYGTAIGNATSDLFPRRDPRVISWFFAGNKWFLITLLSGYVYVVKVAGPRFMKNRPPYDNLKPVIILYNLAMVFLNMYFVMNFLTRSYVGGGYNYVCQGIDFDADDQVTKEFLVLVWWYFWVRVADYLDTLFFVLRKKDSHVSFLHVVHHILVVFNGWYGFTYGADGQAALGIILNSFVHVVMYSYYFLSLLGPAVRPYLWWKRYLTQLQLVQFVIMTVHIMIPLFVDCGYPKAHSAIAASETVFFTIMFLRFYAKAYSGRKNFGQRHEAKNKVQ